MMMRITIPLLLLCLFSFACGNRSTQKPNVLFICVDDLRPELGCYGKDYMHTPNIDALADEGTVFKNHYVQVPTCGASRYSMLTGMLPSHKEHLRNDITQKVLSNLPEQERPETFIHHLKRNGYYTVGIGKISHHPDGLLYGYEETQSDRLELPYSWDEMLFDSGIWGTAWNAFFGYADGENRQSKNKMVKPYETANVSDAGYPDGLSANLAVRKLQELAQKDEPFFLGLGFFKPHLPFTAPQKYWDLYQDEDIPLSSSPYIPKGTCKNALHNSGEFGAYKIGDEKLNLEKQATDEYARKLRHSYFACVSYIDAQIGKVLDELEVLNLSENTIVVIWGDHGWHLGDQAVWGKHTVLESALHSALIIKMPGQSPCVNNNIVSTIDIYPTLMDMCKVDMVQSTDGHSMLPLIQDNAEQWLDASYSYYRNGISLRTPTYRITKYFADKPLIELYDLKEKTIEIENISSGNSEIINSLESTFQLGNTGIFDLENRY